MKGRSSWKALRQADPIVAGSQNASVKGRIDSRIQCRQHDHENHLARGASIDRSLIAAMTSKSYTPDLLQNVSRLLTGGT
jgi:hypothetical protein